MDVEAIPIQVQTPPKEDEPEPAPEPSTEPMDSIEVSDPPDIVRDAEDGGTDEDDQRDDEIVVETNGNGVGEEEEPRSDSPLSSAPDYDAESEAAESHISVEPSENMTRVGKLGDIEGLKLRLDKRLGSDDLLKNLHRVIFKRPGSAHEVKKNIRDFPGFHFIDRNARQVVRDKVAKFTNGQLKGVLTIFGLHVSGAKDTLVDNIINFLDSPWDTKKAVTTNRRRSSGKVKPIAKKKSSDSVKVPQKRRPKPKPEESEEDAPEEEEEEEAGEEEDDDEDFGNPPKKKVKTNPQSKPKKSKPKPKSARKVRLESPIDSSDDDVPLRRQPENAEIKVMILDFLESQDLSTVTKGMVKEALREKYGAVLVKSKKEVIAAAIEEGMQR